MSENHASDDFELGLREGYRAGEVERVALATANGDLRSDVKLWMDRYHQLEAMLSGPLETAEG